MNAEFKSPLLVLSLAVVAWAGMNFAGTVVERRGKQANERRLAELGRENEAHEKALEGRGKAILVKPRVDAPVEIAAAETIKPDTIAAIAPENEGQPKVGTMDAPVP